MNSNPRNASRHRFFHMGAFSWFLTSLLTLTILLAAGTPSRADCGGNSSTTAPTNSGTFFLLCFEQNIDNTPTFDELDGGYLEIYVATLGDTATVTFSSRRYPSLDKSVFLQAHSSYTYRISDSTVQAGLGVTDTMNDLWMTSSGIADNRVVMVRSSSSIVCYGLDYKWESADAFCALPVNSAGTDYRVMSYENSVDVSDGPTMPSQFAVAAFQDNTTVTITPSAPTLGGHAAGAPFTVTLQKGQGVQIQTDGVTPGLDLTGSEVSADHPIVVYGSHSRTEVPHNWRRPVLNFASRDMLLESMPPTSDWGKNFVLDGIAINAAGQFGADGDLVRVMALNANTSVSMNGNPWTTLAANGFEDTMINGPTTIEASGPVLVGEYMHTDYTTNGYGDPFLAIVPPVDQTYNNFTFFLPSNFPNQFVTIVADAASESSIKLDGTALPASAFTPVSGTLAGRQFGVLVEGVSSTGVHTISTPMPAASGFTILGYGIDVVTSYGYTAGSLLVPKRTIAIDPPPLAMGHQHVNWLDFRNTSFQAAYMDSVVFITSPDNAQYGIHTQEKVMFDIGRIGVGGSARVHFVPDKPLLKPVSGTVKIYAHTPDYGDLEPASAPFTLYPDASAGVSPTMAGTLPISAWAEPNPFSAFTTVNFSLPASGDVTLTLYDELGRVVQHVTNGNFAAGSYAIRIERRGLADGIYTCVITSRKLNISQRVPIVAGE